MSNATSGVKATFDAEGNAIQYTDGLINRMEKLQGIVKGELSSRLTSLFALGGIEEAIRRTGMWADSLRVTAAAIGSNTTALQALSIAGDRVGIGQDKLLTFYDKLEKGIIDASNGNVKLNQSFRALGISLDANKTKAEVFDEIINKVGSGNIGQYDASLKEIFGKQFGNVARLGQTIGSGGIAEFQKNHAEEIMPETDVNSLADTYHQIIADFKSIGVMVSPVAKLILNIVGGIVNMLKGVVFAVSDFVKGIPNFFKHPLDTLGNGARNIGIMGQGIVKMGAGVVDLLSFGNTHLKGKYSDYVSKNDAIMGITPELRKNYEAAGEGLGTVITGGTGGAVGRVGSITSKIGVGGDAAAALTRFAESSGLGVQAFNKLKQGLTKSKIAEYATKLDIKNLADISPSEMDALTSMVLKDNKGLGKSVAAFNVIQKAIPSVLYSVGGLSANNPNNFSPTKDNPTIGELRQSSNALNLALGMGAVGGANSNFSIGGTSGMDLQTRLVTLNESMVSLLTQLVQNTSGLPTSADSTQLNNSNP